MKKAIATKIGQPTNYLDMAESEKQSFENLQIEIANNKTKNKPYERLKEIDGLLNEKMPRMIEDLKNGIAFHSSVQALLDEKTIIRESLKL